MSLPEITDDELVMFVFEGWTELALAVYLERTGLDPKTVDMKMLTEQFEWEWWDRMYGGQEP